MRGELQAPLADPEEEASYWCFRSAEGPLRFQERQAFSRWLSGDPDNRERFQAAVAAWQALRDPGHEPRTFTLYTIPRGGRSRKPLTPPAAPPVPLAHWYWVAILTVMMGAIGLMAFFVLRLLL